MNDYLCEGVRFSSQSLVPQCFSNLSTLFGNHNVFDTHVHKYEVLFLDIAIAALYKCRKISFSIVNFTIRVDKHVVFCTQ